MLLNDAILKAQKLNQSNNSSQHKNEQDLSIQNFEESKELNLLKAALSKLFESSKNLSYSSVNDLLNSLGTLSLTSLANAAATENFNSPAGLPTKKKENSARGNKISRPRMRMFALMNLMTTIEQNMFRIQKIWDVAVGHLNCVITHKNSSIRHYGIECFTRLAIKALQTISDSNIQQQSSGFSTFKDKDDSMIYQREFSVSSKSQFHKLVLTPLCELYCSKYEDTRENILNSSFEILESVGQILEDDGWPVLLKLLKNVTTDAPTSSHIRIGFKTIQLISSDFVEFLPFDCLQSFIDTTGLYGFQQYDSNISFTSIGIL